MTNDALTGEISATLQAGAQSSGNRGAALAITPFDTTQITSAGNYSRPQAGDPCHPLSAAAHPPAIASTLVSPGQQFNSFQNLPNLVLEPAPFVPEAGGDTGALPGALSANQTAAVLVHHRSGASDTDTTEADAREILQALRDSLGAEAFSEWAIGVLDGVHAPAVLQPEVHGGGIRCEANIGLLVGDDALPREEAGSAGAVLGLREAGRERRPPPRWGPREQRAVQLAAHLSLLSHPGAPRRAVLRALWQASEGLGVLREALSTLQEMGRSAEGWRAEEAAMSRVSADGECAGLVRPSLHASEASGRTPELGQHERGSGVIAATVRRLTPL